MEIMGGLVTRALFVGWKFFLAEQYFWFPLIAFRPCLFAAVLCCECVLAEEPHCYVFVTFLAALAKTRLQIRCHLIFALSFVCGCSLLAFAFYWAPFVFWQWLSTQA